jgi:hypothetical protein
MSEHRRDREFGGGGVGRGGPSIGVDGEVTETVCPLPDCGAVGIVERVQQRMAEAERRISDTLAEAVAKSLAMTPAEIVEANNRWIAEALTSPGKMSDLLDEDGNR